MSESILIADADLAERTLLEAELLRNGYHVILVEDAAALIQEVEEQRPSAVLLAADFSGPAGGLSLCRHLKGNPITRTTAVILISGRASIPSCGVEESPDEVLLRPICASEMLVRLETVRRLIRYACEAREGSKMDPLTGTFNTTYLLERLRHEVMRAYRYGRSVALVLVDIDRFSTVNQRQGITFGDLVLREVARALTSRLRGVDLVARTGPDDFSVVLPETSLLVARPIAERLRQAVEGLGHQVVDEEDQRLQITASLGVAGLPHPEIHDVPGLLTCARTALARARQAGGNSTVLY
jgi:two-component system, cell cycle response regulator